MDAQPEDLYRRGFPRLRVDFQRGALEVLIPGAPAMTFPMPPDLAAATDMPFRSMTIDVGNDVMLFTLPTGREAIVELGAVEDPLADRAVVYLDQNRWSTLAAAVYGHRPVDRDAARAASESDAAHRLIEMVGAREIVLLMSGSHAVETTPMFDQRRVLHAAAMLEFSRGWQMVRPSGVRQAELAASIRGDAPIAPGGVASLEADVLFAGSLKEVDASDLPAAMAAVFPRMVNMASIYSMLLNPVRIDNPEGTAKIESWAAGFTRLAASMRDERPSRERQAEIAHEAMLEDLGPEIVTLVRGRDELETWLSRARADVGRMPYLSRYRAVIDTRLRNGAPWKPNDFLDLNSLCCAAGYADVVVGERRTIADLRAVRDAPAGAALGTTLAEAVELLSSTRDR